MHDQREATLYLDHGAVKGGPLFIGRFTTAVKMAWAMEATARACARIETPAWVYDAAQLESMRKEDEGCI
jgi:hypothetical protein